MKRLNKQLLDEGLKVPQDIKISCPEDMPERIIQFGEGNFLRAFIDWMVDEMNFQGLFRGKVLVVQPIEHGLGDELNKQDGLYTLFLRGINKGKVVEQKQLVSSISRVINPYSDWQGYLKCATQPELRFIVSNTTEAGIAYNREDRPINRCPSSFPAKLTAFLYKRYKAFDGAPDKGMVIMPCELIDRNGDSLKEIVFRYADEWGLGDGFKSWLDGDNHFLNTLVDRIVTGYPIDEIEDLTNQLGYEDKLIDTGEIFHLWVIEGDKSLAKELPLKEAGLNVLWTDDLTPYRTRKVRILNGAHTMTALMAYLYGLDTVGQCVEDKVVSSYMKKGLYEEIIPTLKLPEHEKTEFAEAVLERFKNPFIEHKLLSISLNSISKWKVRVLPSLLEYLEEKNEIPTMLTFSLAALIVFYRGTQMNGDVLIGNRGEEAYDIQDDKFVLNFFQGLWTDYEEDGDVNSLCTKVLANREFWDEDLNEKAGMTEKVTYYVKAILNNGMKDTVMTETFTQ